MKFRDISTYCYNGHVYLVGEYGSDEEREKALEIAQGVSGVRSVTHYLLQKNAGDTCGWTDNLEISGRIKADLIGDEDI